MIARNSVILSVALILSFQGANASPANYFSRNDLMNAANNLAALLSGTFGSTSISQSQITLPENFNTPQKPEHSASLKPSQPPRPPQTHIETSSAATTKDSVKISQTTSKLESTSVKSQNDEGSQKSNPPLIIYQGPLLPVESKIEATIKTPNVQSKSEDSRVENEPKVNEPKISHPAQVKVNSGLLPQAENNLELVSTKTSEKEESQKSNPPLFIYQGPFVTVQTTIEDNTVGAISKVNVSTQMQVPNKVQSSGVQASEDVPTNQPKVNTPLVISNTPTVANETSDQNNQAENINGPESILLPLRNNIPTLNSTLKNDQTADENSTTNGSIKKRFHPSNDTVKTPNEEDKSFQQANLNNSENDSLVTIPPSDVFDESKGFFSSLLSSFGNIAPPPIAATPDPIIPTVSMENTVTSSGNSAENIIIEPTTQTSPVQNNLTPSNSGLLPTISNIVSNPLLNVLSATTPSVVVPTFNTISMPVTTAKVQPGNIGNATNSVLQSAANAPVLNAQINITVHPNTSLPNITNILGNNTINTSSQSSPANQNNDSSLVDNLGNSSNYTATSYDPGTRASGNFFSGLLGFGNPTNTASNTNTDSLPSVNTPIGGSTAPPPTTSVSNGGFGGMFSGINNVAESISNPVTSTTTTSPTTSASNNVFGGLFSGGNNAAGPISNVITSTTTSSPSTSGSIGGLFGSVTNAAGSLLNGSVQNAPNSIINPFGGSSGNSSGSNSSQNTANNFFSGLGSLANAIPSLPDVGSVGSSLLGGLENATGVGNAANSIMGALGSAGNTASAASSLLGNIAGALGPSAVLNALSLADKGIPGAIAASLSQPPPSADTWSAVAGFLGGMGFGAVFGINITLYEIGHIIGVITEGETAVIDTIAEQIGSITNNALQNIVDRLIPDSTDIVQIATSELNNITAGAMAPINAALGVGQAFTNYVQQAFNSGASFIGGSSNSTGNRNSTTTNHSLSLLQTVMGGIAASVAILIALSILTVVMTVLTIVPMIILTVGAFLFIPLFLLSIIVVPPLLLMIGLCMLL